jgi:drug/metabolite transporter (DMT)-like permease
MRFAGELAAVGTAVCWGSSASLFVVSGRRLGSRVLNRLRLTVALFLLAGTLWLVRGSPWPTWATAGEIRLLAVSAVLGFVIGDGLYFRSLVILGAGRAALLLSLSPVFAAVIAWIFLGETLGPRGILGVTITLSGLATVLYGRSARTEHHAEGSPLVGVLSGIGAALFSSIGYILSKAALENGLDPLSGTVVRVTSAVPVVWLLAPFQGGLARNFAVLRDRIALRALCGGAVLGPFLGVTFSLVALQRTHAAVATSIFSCAPLLAIFLGARFHREVVTWRTVAGALVAIGGIVVLFSR